MKSFFNGSEASSENGGSNLREHLKDNMFIRSAKELKSIRCLCVTAMLIALDIALKLLAGIQVTDSIKISFAFVAIASIGMLYGPTVGFIAGIITDLLGFVIKPTGAFDIRFTLIEALGALIYGLFLYNAVNGKWLLPRIIAAKTTVVIICNLWLTTWAIASVAGKGFLVMLPARVISNLAMLPIDIFILVLFLPIVLRAYNTVFKGVRKVKENAVFTDSGFATALMYIVCLLLVIMCCLGLSEQDLKTKNSDLKKTVADQSETIERMQSEIDRLYENAGIEKPVIEAPKE
jgi:ECF transporter S component (folate family)